MRSKSFFVLAASVLALGLPASAQQVGSDFTSPPAAVDDHGPSTAIVLLGQDGLALSGASLSYVLNGETGIAITHDDATFQVVNTTGGKATLIAEHPSFGSQALEVELPAPGEGVVALYVDALGANAKIFPVDGLHDFLDVSVSTSPVVPPPGQGCQIPDQQGHGSAGYVAVVSDRSSPFLASDCFKPTSDGYLTHAVWWGAYVNIVFGLGTDCSPGPGDQFRIRYFEGNFGGCPGPEIASFDVTLRQKVMTGNLLMGFAHEWQFVSDFHAPVPVQAGECYFIEISNNTPDAPDCFWLWSTAPDADGSSCQTDFSGTPRERDYDLAWCVNLLIDPSACPPPAPLGSDNCSDCAPITGEGVFAFDNSNASNNDGPDDDALCDAFGTRDIDRDVWYCWTSPCDGPVAVSTCGLTAVDTKIAVYDTTSCPPAAADTLACNDDTCGLQSTIQFDAVAGNAYLIRIGTFPGAAGGIGEFVITCLGARPNDDCDDAEGIQIGQTVSGATISATPESPNLPGCEGSHNTSPGVWYEVVGDGTVLRATTCSPNTNYDTKIAIWCGSCDGLVCAAGNDDDLSCVESSLMSTVDWGSVSGHSYLILVSGFGGAEGIFELTVTSLGAPATSDPCLTATSLTLVDASVPDVFIRIRPADLDLKTAGVTPFQRRYDPGTRINLLAPMTWNDRRLMGWVVDGRVLPGNDGRIGGNVRNGREIQAIYDARQGTPTWR